MQRMSPEKVEFDANLIPIQQNEGQWELTSVLTVMLCICQPFFSCIVIFQPLILLQPGKC